MVYQISPGKAYVRGYDVETIANTNLDVPKARTTKEVKYVGIDYNTGTQFIVNRAYGTPNVGLGTTAYVSLRSERIGVTTATAAGGEIGKAKVYNFSAESVNLRTTLQDENEWDLRLFDIQTYTTLGISTDINISLPARITGDSSGAEAYLVSAVEGASEFSVYCSTGQFVKDESFKVNGNDVGPVIKTILDYGLNDVFSVYSNPGVGQTFNADFKLQHSVTPKADTFLGGNPTFTITPGNQGISTITSPGNNFAGIVTAGNYVSYGGTTTDTSLNKVTAVAADGNSITCLLYTSDAADDSLV